MANDNTRRCKGVKKALGYYQKRIDISKEIFDSAFGIYDRAAGNGLVRGRSKKVVICASLYASIRTHKSPITLDEISKVAKLKKKAIGRIYRLLVKELDIKAKPLNSRDTIKKLAGELKLDDGMYKDSLKLLDRVETNGLMSGRNPMSVVAAVIYNTSLKHDKKITQRVISIATGVTEATIRNRNRELEIKLGLPKRPRHPADIRAARVKKERERRRKGLNK